MSILRDKPPTAKDELASIDGMSIIANNVPQGLYWPVLRSSLHRPEIELRPSVNLRWSPERWARRCSQACCLYVS